MPAGRESLDQATTRKMVSETTVCVEAPQMMMPWALVCFASDRQLRAEHDVHAQKRYGCDILQGIMVKSRWVVVL